MCHAKRWLQFIRSICQYHLRGSFVTPQMLGTVPFIIYKFVFNGYNIDGSEELIFRSVGPNFDHL